MLEPFQHVLNVRSHSMISYQHVLQEINQVNVVVDLVKLVCCKQSLIRLGYSEQKFTVIRSIKQVFSSQKLVE